MKKAFSLIELSIVILIIGVVIAGVTQSSALLQKAKNISAQTLTKNSPVAGIEGLFAWFEPTLPESFLSNETEEGAVITRWNDINPQSSNKIYLINSAYLVAEGDSSVSQFYSKNSGPGGLPSIYFGDGYAELSAVTETTEVDGNLFSFANAKQTLFCVYKVGVDNSNVNGSWGYYILLIAGNPYSFEGGYVSGGQVSSDVEIASITNGNNTNLYVNGSSVISTDQNIYSNGVLFLQGDNYYISEIIIFDRILKDEERHSVEQYLGKKYGVEVAITATPTL
jgi:prepilin-type N-terminal cleavage/methylation domain-containing protein